MYRGIYGALVLYAWALAMFIDRDSLSPDDLSLYIATVAPTVLFVFFAFPTIVRSRWRKEAIALAICAITVIVFSCARDDLATAVSVGSLCAMLIALLQSDANISVGFVNALFLVSIPIAAGMHAAQIGQFGVLPGQSSDDNIIWRISLFPYNVTPSWLFALVVIALNHFHNPRRWGRRVMMLIALYFLLLSGSRTGLIVFVLWLAFLWSTRVVKFRDCVLFRLFIPISVVFFVIALNASTLLALLTGFDSPLLNTILLKQDAGADDVDAVSASIVRPLMWALHLDLFLSDPLIGHGTFALQDISPELTALGSQGSEAFITGLFARIGLIALLFLVAMQMIANIAARQNDRCSYCLMILFAISSLAYGSYIVPYDFVFLLLFGAMNHARISSEHRRAFSTSQSNSYCRIETLSTD